ncbi:MAG: O-methyltransferase [Candidatus Nanopelagicales bacterium]
MIAPNADSFAYADGFAAEDEVLTTAREKAAELGCVPISGGSGALLRFVARAISAAHVVEIGTGAGVSTLWLLRGMTDDGVITSIDIELEHQRVARETLAAAEIAQGRYRLIAGRALDVLPRLTDGAYDMVLVDADKSEYTLYFEQALRLLRPGGVIAFDNALWGDRVADPAQRDAATVALRDLVTLVRGHEDLTPVLVPSGDGLLLAVVH